MERFNKGEKPPRSRVELVPAAQHAKRVRASACTRPGGRGNGDGRERRRKRLETVVNVVLPCSGGVLSRERDAARRRRRFFRRQRSVDGGRVSVITANEDAAIDKRRQFKLGTWCLSRLCVCLYLVERVSQVIVQQQVHQQRQ